MICQKLIADNDPAVEIDDILHRIGIRDDTGLIRCDGILLRGDILYQKFLFKKNVRGKPERNKENNDGDKQKNADA